MTLKARTRTNYEEQKFLILTKAGVRYWEDATVNGVEDENGDVRHLLRTFRGFAFVGDCQH